MNNNWNDENYIGLVIGGSISRGIDIRLDKNTKVEELVIGRFIEFVINTFCGISFGILFF